MLNLEKKGIIEIVGDPGVGKTHLAIHLQKNLKTLYISSRISKENWFPSNFLIRRIDSFLSFKIFIAKDIKKLVEEQKIEKIIINGLEDYLFEVETPKKHSNEIFKIIKVLKYLCFIKNVQIFIINSSHNKWKIEEITISNNYFGLPWEYLINQRYYVYRIANQRFINFFGNEILCKKFNITNNGIEFEV